MTTNTSLNYYSSRNLLNARIAENMLDVTSMHEGFSIFERKACICFSKAYEICKELIEASPVSVWKVPDYYNSATFLYIQGDLSTIMKAVTISIVLILSEHFDEKWRQDNLKFLEKLKDGLKNLQLSNEKNEDQLSKTLMRFKGIKSACVNAYETLRRGTDIDYIIPFEEFSTKNINDTRVSVSGENKISREELKKVIEDAVKEAFDKQKKEIDEEERTNEEIKKVWGLALANAKAEIESKIPRIEYDEKNEGLKIITGSDKHNNGKNESLEEIIKTTVKKYFDENTATDEDIDEIFADVYGKELDGQVNRELSGNDNEEANDLKKDYQAPTTTIDKNLQQHLDEVRKTIEEQEATINDLNETIKKYQMRGLPPAKRKGIALGLTPLQADIFGDFLANKLSINFSNKKEELSLILNSVFGHGRSSLANKMSRVNSQDSTEDRLYVASIFGPSSPNLAREICSDWNEDTLAPWEEDKEGEVEND